MDTEGLAEPGGLPDAAQLARDAELIADYAARTGNLPADSDIFERLDAYNAALASGGSPDRPGLYAAMGKAARAILPMTLYKLRKRGTLHGQFRSVLISGVPVLLGLMTLMLTFYLAFQSSELQKADSALKEYQQWADERPREKIYNAWKMYRYEKVLNETKPPLAQLDAYNQSIAEARRLIDKGAAIQELLLDSQKMQYIPRFWEYHGPEWLRKLVASLNSEAGGGPDWPDVELKNEPLKGCADLLRAMLSDAKPVASKAKRGPDLEADLESQKCYWQLLRIDGDKADYSPFTSIYPIKIKVNLLTVWLLPSLYGLLGACVYLMRNFVMHDGLRRLNRDTTFLNTLALFLRIALGGLAGVIIGWFWVPPPVTGNTVPLAISSIPFGLSFLAGFSIETLFSLIDRLNQNLGKPPPPDSGTAPVTQRA